MTRTWPFIAREKLTEEGKNDPVSSKGSFEQLMVKIKDQNARNWHSLFFYWCHRSLVDWAVFWWNLMKEVEPVQHSLTPSTFCSWSMSEISQSYQKQLYKFDLAAFSWPLVYLLLHFGKFKVLCVYCIMWNRLKDRSISSSLLRYLRTCARITDLGGARHEYSARLQWAAYDSQCWSNDSHVLHGIKSKAKPTFRNLSVIQIRCLPRNWIN